MAVLIFISCSKCFSASLADSFDVGNDPVIVAACADGAAIFADCASVKIDGRAAVGTVFVINKAFFAGSFSKGADKGPVIGHEELAVSVAADNVSGSVVGDIIGDS